MEIGDPELVGIERVEAAGRLLDGIAERTPCERSRALEEVVGGPAFLKCENLQRAGSFKIRGAYTRISALSQAERGAGVVAASAGNHGQGVALAASLLGARATVFMPVGAALPKLAATRGYGAEVILGGEVFGDAVAAAQEFAVRTGRVFIHPYDHPDIIAGQGTVGLELLDQCPEVRTVVVCAGGGGLLSGVALTVKSRRSDVRVVGVQAEGASTLIPSLAAGHPVTVAAPATIADGIAVNTPGELTLEHVRTYVDEVVTVTDEWIAQAVIFLLERAKLLAEPAGAAGVAAMLQGVGTISPPVACVVSGGNVDPLVLLRIISFGLSEADRYLVFRTRVPDRPGQLSRILAVIAEMGANVLGIEHHRLGHRIHLGEVEISFQLEAGGPDHAARIRARLLELGYPLEDT